MVKCVKAVEADWEPGRPRCEAGGIGTNKWSVRWDCVGVGEIILRYAARIFARVGRRRFGWTSRRLVQEMLVVLTIA
jgi:hypothetical protein